MTYEILAPVGVIPWELIAWFAPVPALVIGYVVVTAFRGRYLDHEAFTILLAGGVIWPIVGVGAVAVGVFWWLPKKAGERWRARKIPRAEVRQ